MVGGPFTIPARTPFLLTAAGNDVDGDSLTYTWEQYDAGVLQLLDNVNKASGPLFRSFDPVASPSRTFPRMSSILANTTNANTGTCPPLPGRHRLLVGVPADGRPTGQVPGLRA